jgi:hypothetical protein
MDRHAAPYWGSEGLPEVEPTLGGWHFPVVPGFSLSFRFVTLSAVRPYTHLVLSAHRYSENLVGLSSEWDERANHINGDTRWLSYVTWRHSRKKILRAKWIQNPLVRGLLICSLVRQSESRLWTVDRKHLFMGLNQVRNASESCPLPSASGSVLYYTNLLYVSGWGVS